MKGWILSSAVDEQTFRPSPAPTGGHLGPALAGPLFGNLDVKWVRTLSGRIPPDLDFIFALGEFDPALREVQAPLILVDAVAPTLKSLRVDDRFVRINAWNTFLQRPLAEVAVLAGVAQARVLATLGRFFEAWGKPFVLVPDIPGMPSASIVSMIINEAYFALAEGVSDRAAIDSAMKLGTNYPFGPFEWAEKIGPKRVVGLLDTLYAGDPLYEPAPLLREEAG